MATIEKLVDVNLKIRELASRAGKELLNSIYGTSKDPSHILKIPFSPDDLEALIITIRLLDLLAKIYDVVFDPKRFPEYKEDDIIQLFEEEGDPDAH